MDKQLTAWLNSATRNYKEGVELYQRHGNDAYMLRYFLTGNTRASTEKLFESLKAIYYAKKHSTPGNEKHKTGAWEADKISLAQDSKQVEESKTGVVLNTELETICKAEADKHFKELMNVRAKLFQYCSIEPDGRENNEDEVRLREIYVMELLKLQPEHHEAYEKLRHVKQHGKLPDAAPVAQEEIPTDPLKLEKARVNLMKNISKLRKKEATAERVQLLQEHEAKLKLIQDGLSKFQ